MQLDNFTRAYIAAALWSTTDDEGQPLDDRYSTDDIAPETMAAMVRDCEKFQNENDLSDIEDSNAGHDFWLTRNGHGSGFWDGDYPENGEELTAASKRFGEAEIYVGDDGYIYQAGTETPGVQPPREDYNPSNYDTELLKSMGVQARLNNPLLSKASPKLAFNFSEGERQYDYEANGNEVVLITPGNTTKLLVGDEAREFWVILDGIEDEVLPEVEHHKRIQELISSFFKNDKSASYVIQVNATSLKKASVTFVAEAVEKEDKVEKFKFTSAQQNARRFDRAAAERIHAHLASFNLTGELVRVGSSYPQDEEEYRAEQERLYYQPDPDEAYERARQREIDENPDPGAHHYVVGQRGCVRCGDKFPSPRRCPNPSKN